MNREVDENRFIECMHCAMIKAYVVQYRKNKGVMKPIYRCTNCEKRFIKDDGFKKHRYSPVLIKSALEMLNQGTSLSQVVYYLNQNFRVITTRKTILDWKNKFSNAL